MQVAYGHLKSVVRVNRAIKKKLYAGYYITATELSKSEAEKFFKEKSFFRMWGRVGPEYYCSMTSKPLNHSNPIYKVELWRTL
jgi:hypothetical protein